MVSGSGDREIKIWDWKTGVCKKSMKGHTDEVMCMEFIGEVLATGSFDQTVRVWDMQTGTPQHILRGHSDWVYAIQFDGSTIVSGSWDATVKIWQMDQPVAPAAKSPTYGSHPPLRRRNTISNMASPSTTLGNVQIFANSGKK